MKSIVLLLIALCGCGSSSATSVEPRTLEALVREADHIVVATVIRVDMVDQAGRPVRDRQANTGPGLQNRIRFHLAVGDVLFTRDKALPPRLVVNLWSMWHYALGTMQDDVTGSRGIFLLKGDDFQPVYPAFFQRGLDERAEIERLLRAMPAAGARQGLWSD